LKFLSNPFWLKKHILSVAQFQELANTAYRQPLFPKPEISIKVNYSSSLFRYQRQGRRIILQVHEGFINAPFEEKKTLVIATFSKSLKARQHLKIFNRTEYFQSVVHALEQYKGKSKTVSKGKDIDLQPIYDKLNKQYFEGKLPAPRLTWGRRGAFRRLGYYHPESDTITISRIFDSVDAPIYALEFVLFHEMLHKKLGLKESNGRRYAHTRIFKDSEAQFSGAEKAEKAIQALIRTRSKI
jgi:hypothetical protein